MPSIVVRAPSAQVKWMLTLVLVLSCGLSCAASRIYTVGILFDSSSELHEEAIVGVEQKLKEGEVSNVKFVRIDINQSHFEQVIHNDKFDFLISFGIEAAKSAITTNIEYPILYAMVPKQSYLQLANQNPGSANTISGQKYVLYLEQKPSRQLLVINALLGDDIDIGLVVGEYSRHEGEEIAKLARLQNERVTVEVVNENEQPIELVRDVLKHSDVYVALYDSRVLDSQNARWLLYMAYRMRKPVIGFSPSYTRAGALASIYATPQQVGMQVAEWVIEMINGHLVEQVQYPKYFTVSVNDNIRRLLRIDKRSEEEIANLIKKRERSADEVRDQ